MKEKLIEKIKSIGWWILGILIFLGLILITIFIIKRGLWLVEKVLPFLMNLTGIFSMISFFVLLPMTIFKKTRKLGGAALVFSSFLFGATLWIYSALVAYILWGLLGLFIGLFILGIGVVPVGLLAASISGEWMIVGSIIYMLILTIGARIFGLWIVEKSEKDELKLGREFEETG